MLHPSQGLTMSPGLVLQQWETIGYPYVLPCLVYPSSCPHPLGEAACCCQHPTDTALWKSVAATWSSRWSRWGLSLTSPRHPIPSGNDSPLDVHCSLDFEVNASICSMPYLALFLFSAHSFPLPALDVSQNSLLSFAFFSSCSFPWVVLSTLPASASTSNKLMVQSWIRSESSLMPLKNFTRGTHYDWNITPPQILLFLYISLFWWHWHSHIWIIFIWPFSFNITCTSSSELLMFCLGLKQKFKLRMYY